MSRTTSKVPLWLLLVAFAFPAAWLVVASTLEARPEKSAGILPLTFGPLVWLTWFGLDPGDHAVGVSTRTPDSTRGVRLAFAAAACGFAVAGVLLRSPLVGGLAVVPAAILVVLMLRTR